MMKQISWQTICLTVVHYLLPQRALCAVAYFLTRIRWPWFKNRLICWFIGKYKVEMNDALLTEPEDYVSFNAFFTRELKPEARPIAVNAQTLISPVDGFLNQQGDLNQEQSLLQAKGVTYTLSDLLAEDDELISLFCGGQYINYYLAPHNYHRVHMPFSGELQRMVLVPGRLFSVSPKVLAAIPNILSGNERVICLFDTALGPMAVILIGALNVGSISTVWHGEVTPQRRLISQWQYAAPEKVHLARGDEVGRFNMGSAVIVLLPKGCADLNCDVTPGTPVKMGELAGAAKLPPQAD